MNRRDRHRPRGPREAGDVIARFADALQPASTLAEVQRVWAGAVGEAVAVNAEPVAERAGVVTVSCGSAVWAQELELMGPELCARLNEALGGDVVRGLRCQAAPPRRRAR